MCIESATHESTKKLEDIFVGKSAEYIYFLFDYLISINVQNIIYFDMQEFSNR